MKVEQRSWTVEELVQRKDKIELTPAWQRGPAWKQPRQVLLLDSILRGMDIPKIYLRNLPMQPSSTMQWTGSVSLSRFGIIAHAADGSFMID